MNENTAGSNLVFIVEDNEWYSKMLAHIVSMNPEFEVMLFKTGKACLDKLYLKPFAVSLDFRLPDMTGLEILQKIKAYNAHIEVLVVSEQDDIATVVDLLKYGAYDYMVKGNDIKNRIFNSLANIYKNQKLKSQIEEMSNSLKDKFSFQNILIGQSPQIRKVYELIEKTLNNDITVSITGETGTGKEMVAKAIHYNSRRKAKNFVAVNVSAVPEELIESEFFGHEKGAFTGAMARRIGKFEEADGGTLFLDEIGDMPSTFQTKLLRVLQEQEIVRVGSNKPVKVDVRIVVATHKNLEEEVRKGNFREDLYYRLIGLLIPLPPLRDRGQDIILLAQHFISQFCKNNKIPLKSLSKECKHKLLSYHFPGNVRELKTLSELAVVMSETDEIGNDDYNLESDKRNFGNMPISGDLTLRQYELIIVKDFLKRNNNDIKKVAKKLNIGTATIYRMLKAEKEIMSESMSLSMS